MSTDQDPSFLLHPSTGAGGQTPTSAVTSVFYTPLPTAHFRGTPSTDDDDDGDGDDEQSISSSDSLHFQPEMIASSDSSVVESGDRTDGGVALGVSSHSRSRPLSWSSSQPRPPPISRNHSALTLKIDKDRESHYIPGPEKIVLAASPDGQQQAVVAHVPTPPAHELADDRPSKMDHQNGTAVPSSDQNGYANGVGQLGVALDGLGLSASSSSEGGHGGPAELSAPPPSLPASSSPSPSVPTISTTAPPSTLSSSPTIVSPDSKRSRMLPLPSPLSRQLNASPTPDPSPAGTPPPIDIPRPNLSPRPTSLPPPPKTPPTSNGFDKPLKSPCFLHTNLNASSSLSDYLNRPGPSSSSSGPTSSAAHHHPHAHQASEHHHKHSSGPTKPKRTKHHGHLGHDQRTKSQLRLEGYEEAEDGVLEPEDEGRKSDGEREREEESSLTRQLAQTAVGVREMSKALGRTRVRTNIQNVLIVTKARDNRLIKLTKQLALYLMGKKRGGSSVGGEAKRGLVVYVDAQLRTSKRFDAAGIERDHPEYFVPFQRRRSSSSASINTMMSGSESSASAAGGSTAGEGQLRYWTSEMCSNKPNLFDFVVTLGGDGTVLFTSWLFQKIVPPVLPFALGSLGFLTNFDFSNFKQDMDTVIDKGIRVNLRMRFTCTVYRAIAPDDHKGKGVKAVKSVGGDIMMGEVGKSGWEALEGGLMSAGAQQAAFAAAGGAAGAAGGAAAGVGGKKEKEVMCFTTRPMETFEVLNDLVVDRGPSPYVSLLELFGDEHHMTTVQADGLTVSTPTGSTAYSLSAGGSLVHPEIPALLITPICPHTLSFRPMLLPDSMELRICVPYNSRSTAWASFDGRGRVELKQGDHIKVEASKYPFPTVCADKQSTDWFSAIQRTLRWNEREKQKSFVVIEEPRVPKPLQPPKVHVNGDDLATTPTPQPEPALAPEEPEEEEEDEKFDIDDSSTVPGSPTTDKSSPTTQNSSTATSPLQPGDDGAPAPPLTARPTTHSSPQDPHHHRHRSGVESPSRFASEPPHPPKLNARHVSDALNRTTNTKRAIPSELQLTSSDAGGRRTPEHGGGGGGGGGGHEVRTPRAGERMMQGGGVGRLSAGSKSQVGRAMGGGGSSERERRRQREEREREEEEEREEEKGNRAFAFFGQDESDSGVSDSDLE